MREELHYGIVWYFQLIFGQIPVAKSSNQSHLSLGLRYSAEIQYKKVKQGKTSYYNRVESPEKQISLWKNGRRPLPEGEWADVCLYSSTVTMSGTYLRVRINDLVLRALYWTLLPSPHFNFWFYHVSPSKTKFRPIHNRKENDIICASAKRWYISI